MRKTILLIITLVLMTGCINNSPTSHQPPTSITEENTETADIRLALDNAEKLTVTTKASFGRKLYSVSGDNIDLKMSRRYITAIGDEVELVDDDYNVIASERQLKRYSVMAEVYNEHGEIIGYIGREPYNLFINPFTKTNIYDKDGNKVAKVKSKLALINSEYIIEDLDGIDLYKIKEKFTLVLNEYEITKLEDSGIPIEIIVFTTLILDNIKKDS